MRLHIALIAAAALCVAGRADAATMQTLTLSDLTSEPATNPASDLDARFDFTVNDPGDTLTLTVHNDTSGPAEYALNQVYFNFTSDVTSIVGSSLPTGWTFATDPCPPGSPSTGSAPCNDVGGSDTKADGFGIYDASIKAAGVDAIAAGGSASFVFSLSGSGITAVDFVSESSRNTGTGDAILGLAAAKFIQGPQVSCPAPNDDLICDSAFGMVPEPSLSGLLGMALLTWTGLALSWTGLAVHGRRR